MSTLEKKLSSMPRNVAKIRVVKVFLRAWLHILKIFLMENSIFCVMGGGNFVNDYIIV